MENESRPPVEASCTGAPDCGCAMHDVVQALLDWERAPQSAGQLFELQPAVLVLHGNTIWENDLVLNFLARTRGLTQSEAVDLVYAKGVRVVLRCLQQALAEADAAANPTAEVEPPPLTLLPGGRVPARPRRLLRAAARRAPQPENP